MTRASFTATLSGALTALVVCLAPHATSAQDLPALFNVVDVASDDVLNVRSAPNGGAGIVGTLAYNAKGIEIVDRDGNWGLVNLGEGTGWTSLRYLDPVVDGFLPEHPRFSCSGTEPFWNLDVVQGQKATLSMPDWTERLFGAGMVRAASGRPYPFAMSGAAGTETLTVVMWPRMCSDGMSDRSYGLETTVVLTGNAPLILSGCCSLVP